MDKTNSIKAALAVITDSVGFRVNTADLRRLGVREHLVFDACGLGLARLERSYLNGSSVYLIFA